MKSVLKSVLLVLSILFCFQVSAQTKAEKEIRNILETQNQAWNKGNIDEFMIGYWNHDSLLFVGSSGPKYGWQTTLKNYKKNYPDTAHMGKLHFDILQIKKLSKKNYFVLGKWLLKRSVGDAGGFFTLLFKRIKNKWVIIVDHSS